jgi:hypothetical protein
MERAMTNSMIAAWRAERPWLAGTIVCDGLLPWANDFLPPGAKLADQLRRFHANGVDHISLTAARRREAAASGRGGSLWPWSGLGRRLPRRDGILVRPIAIDRPRMFTLTCLFFVDLLN